MPKISVIMPAYNAEKYIAEAIDSILGQTFGDFEFIILNDCSTDRTEEIILSYDDPRIVYLKNEQNMGVAATLNKGLAAATGEYIARMDADDISLPQRFEKQLCYMEAHPETVVCGSGLERFGEAIFPQVRTFSADVRQMRIDMLFACGLAHPTVMMRRQATDDLGGYDTAYEGMEDYELWCRVLEKGEITTLLDVLLRYRVHGSQVTKNPSVQYLARLRRLKQRQLEQLGLPTQGEEAESFYAFCTGTRLEKPEQLAVFCRFLKSVVAANAKHQRFDQRLLQRNFRDILLPAAMALPTADAKALCAQTDLLTRRVLTHERMKKTVKRLLRKQRKAQRYVE